MSECLEKENHNQAIEIIINSRDYQSGVLEIKKYYLALISNPKFSDKPIDEWAAIAADYHDTADHYMTCAMTNLLVRTRFN